MKSRLIYIVCCAITRMMDFTTKLVPISFESYYCLQTFPIFKKSSANLSLLIPDQSANNFPSTSSFRATASASPP